GLQATDGNVCCGQVAVGLVQSGNAAEINFGRCRMGLLSTDWRHRLLLQRTKFADHVDIAGAVNVSTDDDTEIYGANDMSDLKIFISHKMPKDGVAASLIGQFIASNSGSKIEMILAENFPKGGRLTPEITAAIQSADFF